MLHGLITLTIKRSGDTSSSKSKAVGKRELSKSKYCRSNPLKAIEVDWT